MNNSTDHLHLEARAFLKYTNTSVSIGAKNCPLISFLINFSVSHTPRITIMGK